MEPIVLETVLPKLRISERTPFWDVYVLNTRVLLVGLDRVCWQGQAVPIGIPYKGLYTVQTQRFLYEKLEENSIPTHYLTAEVRRMSSVFQMGQEVLKGRSLLLKKASCIPLRCEVVRYAYGPYFQNPRYFSSLAQGPFPQRPEEGETFSEPVLFIQGQRRNGRMSYLSSGQVAEIIGDKIAEDIRDLSRMGFVILEQALRSAGWILGRVVFYWGFYTKDIVLARSFYGEEDLTLWKEKPASQSWIDFPPTYELMPLWDFFQEKRDAQLEALPKELIQEISQRYGEVCTSLTGYQVG